MEMNYYKSYSPALGRDMECKVYGHKGRPVLFIPCQDGRFYDFENFHMTDTWAPWIESGEVMVFAIDTVDQETWSDTKGDPYWRIRRYEQWLDYITDELVPFMRNMVNDRNGWSGYPGIMVFGCSLGATHGANLYFRRPDLFDSVIALSGIYDTQDMYGGYMDEVVYANDPCASLSGMPEDHPYISMFNARKIILCVGQGAWEEPLLAGTRRLDAVLKQKGIRAWVDYWGYDVSHDWPWWKKQIRYFLPFVVGQP